MSSSRQYTGRVIDIHDVSPDTRKFTVEIDNKQRLVFHAGQYVYLSLPGFEKRAFSIASSPHEPLLEFHVKNAGRGLSAHILDALQPGNTLSLSEPLGSSYLRHAARPIVALAGGLGIAPLKSIIDACLYDRAHPPVHLYWGVRLREQLYLDDYFRTLSKKHPRFSYIPVLSEEADGGYRTGMPGSAATEDLETFSGASIYMAGPSAMIDGVLPLLLQHGAEEDYIFSDAFAVQSQP